MMASEDGFMKDPALVHGWYEWRRQVVAQAIPNDGHDVIAQLESICPRVTVVTQNVDDLHERAGSTDVLHLHGRIMESRCIVCEEPYHADSHTAIDLSTPGEKIEPPHCKLCGNLVRPGIVWFGESLDINTWEDAVEATEQCDLFIVCGTSGEVFPAASLPFSAHRKDIPIVQINAEPTRVNKYTTWNLQGNSGDILPRVFDKLLAYLTELEENNGIY